MMRGVQRASPLPRPIGPPPSSKQREMAGRMPGPPNAGGGMQNMMSQLMWPTGNATPTVRYFVVDDVQQRVPSRMERSTSAPSLKMDGEAQSNGHHSDSATDKQARRREQNRVSAKRAYEKRAAIQAGVEQDVQVLKKQLLATSNQIATLASFMAELPPAAKIAETPEFAALVVRADATSSNTTHGQWVYCAFDGQELLGVFADENAAKWRVSSVKTGRVQAQLVDQSAHPGDRVPKMPPAPSTAPGEPSSKAAAAVPVPPTAPSRAEGKDII